MVSYEDMFSFVEQQLTAYDTHGGVSKNKIKYSRFDHTKRVHAWAMRLYEAFEEKEKVDLDALKIAAIFHDVGYNQAEREHAEAGAEICRKYLTEHGYETARVSFICDLVARHSDKSVLFDDIPRELVLLMEADLFDDTGAHGIVMDFWIEATKDDVSFESIMGHIEKFTLKMMQENPMRTAEAKRIWEEKKKLTESFYQSYREDLSVE